MILNDSSEINACELVAQFGVFPLDVDIAVRSNDSLSLAIATPTAGISLWDLRTFMQLSQLEIAEKIFQAPTLSINIRPTGMGPVAVRDLVFSDDDTFIAAALMNDEVHIWIREGTLLEVIKRPAVQVAFMPDHNILALCLHNGRVEFWDFLPARLVSFYDFFPDPIGTFLTSKELTRCAIAFSKDGNQLAILASFYFKYTVHSLLQICDVHIQNGQIQVFRKTTVRGPDTSFKRICYRQNRYVYCDASSQYIWIVETDKEQVVTLLQDPSWYAMKKQATSINGSNVAIGLIDGRVKIWSVEREKEVFQFQAHDRVNQENDAISAMFWLEDRAHFVTAGTVHLKNAIGRSKPKKYSTIKLWKFSF